MMAWEPFIVLALATLAGATVQAATGFGFAIIAAPVFLVVLNSPTAIPILTALHVVQSLMMVPRLAPKASRWHLRRLSIGAVVGAPVGLWLFNALSVRGLKLTAGIAILLVLALIVLRERRTTGPTWASAGGRHGTGATVLTGALSSLLTVLLVMPGPPLMAYFMSQKHSGDTVRALSLTFFAVCYVALTLHHQVTVGYTADAWALMAWLAPVVVIGTVGGIALTGAFTANGFRLAVLGLLFLSGLSALVSAAFA